MLLDKCEGNQKYLLYFLNIPEKKKKKTFCSAEYFGMD